MLSSPLYFARVVRCSIRFSGVANDELLKSELARLEAWIAARKLETRPPVTFAYYNDPFTPGPLRRNEVLIRRPCVQVRPGQTRARRASTGPGPVSSPSGASPHSAAAFGTGIMGVP